MSFASGLLARLLPLFALASAPFLGAQTTFPYSRAPESSAEAPFRFHGPSSNPLVMTIRGDSVVIGGIFEGADGILGKNILVWDGSRWSEGYPGIHHLIRGLRFAGEKLYASGFLSVDNSWPDNRVAVWEQGSWKTMGAAFPFDEIPGPIALLGDTVHVATRGGVYRWNGTAWIRLGKAFKGDAARLENFGGKIWLAGDLEQDTAIGNVMVWEAGEWNAPAGTALKRVVDMVRHQESIFTIEHELRPGEGKDYFRIARQADTGWVDVTESTDPFYLGNLASNGEDLYLTGVALDGFGLFRWDGQAFERTHFAEGRGGATQGYLAFTRGGKLIQSANFSSIADKRMDYLAAWDGKAWNPMTTGGPLGINAPPTVLFSDGERLFAGSNILTLAGDENTELHAVTAWDGETWDSLDGGLRHPWDFRLAEVHAFGKGQDGIYAGGLFPESRSGPALNVARWDGKRWHPLGDGFAGKVRAFQARGKDMVVAGQPNPLQTAGSNSLPAGQAAGIWNGTAWSTLGNGISGDVRSLAEFKGDLYAAGRFRILPDGPVCGIARFSGDAWTVLPRPSKDSLATDSVYALTVFRDRLYALGTETQPVYPDQQEALMAWDGGAWEHIEGVSQGFALTSDSNALYAGFITFRDYNARLATGYVRAARFDGREWVLMPALAAYSDIRTMALHGGHLYLGCYPGNFGGKAASWLARWNLQGLSSSSLSRRSSTPPAKGARRYFHLKNAGALRNQAGMEIFGIDGRRMQVPDAAGVGPAAVPVLLVPDKRAVK